jgi:hypothetical protein
MADRPKITKISITYEVHGKSVTKDIDPSETEAIFFSDRAVKEILALFYHPKHPSKHRGHKHTPEEVIKSWETPTESGSLPALMSKFPGCSSKTIP